MTDILFFKNQGEFSDWLDNNTDSTELWVGFYKKNSGLATMTWSESVDVALCFGWIDGIRKSIDEKSYKIRFTPRKKNSGWSAVNVKKVQELIKQNKMRPVGLELYKNRRDKVGYKSADRNIPLSIEFEKLIKVNKSAWKFFNDLAPSYKRDSIWWVMSAKKEETRLRRLNILIESSKEGLKIPNLRKK
jgi:uncharacterized protein YdeI (YjbR/CyaY-like superfamily)